MDEVSPDLEQEVNRIHPDFTNLALGQIQLQNSIDVFAQTLRSVQESLLSMSTRITKMEVAAINGSIEHEYHHTSNLYGSENVSEPSLAAQGRRLKFQRYNGEKDPIV